MTRQRQIKIKVSNKIEGHCPARLSCIQEKNGLILAKYVSTHVGHALEVDILHLTGDERSMIAGKLLQGIPSQRILLDMEGNAAQPVRYYVDCFQGRRDKEKTFIRVDRSLWETGSFKSKPGGVGRSRQTRTVEAEEHVLQLVEENASTNVRKLSSECNITKTIVHDILQEQLTTSPLPHSESSRYV